MMGELRLRPMELEDVDLMYQVENDMSLWHLGSANVPYSHEILRAFVLNSTGDIFVDKQVRLMLEDDKKQVVGMIDLTDFSPKNMRAEVGIVVLEPFRERGYATEAIRQLDEYARKVLFMHQLYAYVESMNEKCLHVFQSNGYQIVATLSQWIRVGENFKDVVMLQKIF